MCEKLTQDSLPFWKIAKIVHCNFLKKYLCKFSKIFHRPGGSALRTPYQADPVKCSPWTEILDHVQRIVKQLKISSNCLFEANQKIINLALLQKDCRACPSGGQTKPRGKRSRVRLMIKNRKQGGSPYWKLLEIVPNFQDEHQPK